MDHLCCFFTIICLSNIKILYTKLITGTWRFSEIKWSGGEEHTWPDNQITFLFFGGGNAQIGALI